MPFKTKFVVSLVFTAFLLALSWQLHAFCPSNGFRCLFGVFGETHEDITKKAIGEVVQQTFGTGKLTASMKKALKEIVDANAAMDEFQTRPELHFDNESFINSQNRVAINLLTQIKVALSLDDPQTARIALGRALHAIQDFYSHSNWVELGNAGPHPALGRKDQPLGDIASRSEATCTACTDVCSNCDSNLITAKLTSGYFRVSKPILQKCSHGGPSDTSTQDFPGGINKDVRDCGFSPHSSLHPTAALLAKEATKQFLNNVKADVTARQFKELLGVGPTLALAIDTTGSMGDIIGQVQQQAIQLVNSRVGTDLEPLKYVLAAFNDPFGPGLFVTSDAEAFKFAISQLFASEGGDCPELAMGGARVALIASEDGGDLFLFTDASAKDASLANQVDSLAVSKGIKIYPLLFGSCSPIDPAFNQVAENSGGQVFFLQRNEAGNIARLADLLVRPDAVQVLSIRDTLSATGKNFSVPVDSTMGRVTFSVSGTASVVVNRPDGTAVQSTDPGVTLISLSNGFLLSVLSPPAGAWRVTVNGTGEFSLLASGENPLHLDSFEFLEVRGRPGHQGLFPIPGYPVLGQSVTARADVSEGSFRTAQFDLRSKAGASLQSLNLNPELDGAPNQFFGSLTPSSSGNLVYVTGLDNNGLSYQRLLPAPLRPQTVQIVPPLSFTPPDVTYVFQVKNLGPSDTFEFTAFGTNILGVDPLTFQLGTNQTANVSVMVQLIPFFSNTAFIIANVRGVNTGATNFAILKVLTSDLLVETNRPPFCGRAVPSLSRIWPPDHRLMAVSIGGVTDPDADPVTVRIDRVMQDEPTNGLGDGDACPDAVGLGGSSVQLRAERSGTADGRVYTIFFTATDNKGGSCQGTLKVAIPLDQNQNRSTVDGGPQFDSTVCPSGP